MPPITFGTVVRLLIWSLIVGAALAFFDITPQQIFSYVTGWAEDVFSNLQLYAGQAITYILLGAVVVIPVWLASIGINRLRRRRH